MSPYQPNFVAQFELFYFGLTYSMNTFTTCACFLPLANKAPIGDDGRALTGKDLNFLFQQFVS